MGLYVLYFKYLVMIGGDSIGFGLGADFEHYMIPRVNSKVIQIGIC